MTFPTEADQKLLPWAEQFKAFRQSYLYSQVDLAHALGCCRRTIVAVEAGQTYPRMATLRAFRSLERRHQKAAAAHQARLASMYTSEAS